MDIREKGWHLHMKISGVSLPVTHEGSVMELIAHALTHIRANRVPQKRDGTKEITIRLSPHKITEGTLEEWGKSDDAESLLDTSLAVLLTHNVGETYDEFFDRLIEDGYDRASALMIAADAFDMDTTTINREQEDWLTDSRAIMFRKLHASQQSYDSADPHEAQALKDYCKSRWPERVENMRLRD